MAAFPTLDDAIKAAEEEAARKRAQARATARNEKAALDPGKLVRVRVLKMGHDKISMGAHVGGVGEAYYERGEVFDIGESIAHELEDKGYVEIQGDTPTEAAEPQQPELELPQKGTKG